RRHQPVGDVERRLRCVRQGLWLQRAKNADADAQHIHRVRAGRKLLERGLHAGGQTAQTAEPQLVCVEFGARGQLSVEEKVRDLFEVTLRREVEDVVATIVEVVSRATDRAECGVARGDTR